MPEHEGGFEPEGQDKKSLQELKEKYRGLRKEGGIQYGIEDIEESGDAYEVIPLAGCDRAALIDVLDEIVNETGKVARANFNGNTFTVSPE